ncbi:uncharacterized protein LOC126844251 [Adelges cooleyi]|uniref:uncharacterized protein LOC126844251 n=1 Tax=Adelges cooleyi TaxID=133065 RepID=UPI00217FB8D6|nr:uncharacterized protein LOC126844251 [Adelges cooleyi]
MSSFYVNCYKCNIVVDEPDIPIKCDGCNLLVHSMCSGLTASEIKCFSLNNRRLKYFCDACNNGLRDIPELKQLINRVLTGVNELKNQENKNDAPHSSEEVIINEVCQPNIIESNSIIDNVPESILVDTNEIISHDSNLNTIQNTSPVHHGKEIQLITKKNFNFEKRLAFCHDKSVFSKANEEKIETFHYPSLINDRPSTDIMKQCPSPPLYSSKGMMLMLKMGWKPGDKIGKPQSGPLDHLLLDINFGNIQILSSPISDEELGQHMYSTIANCDERLGQNQSGFIESAYIGPISEVKFNKKDFVSAETKENIDHLSNKPEIRGNHEIPSSSKADEELRKLKCPTAVHCNKGMQLMLKMGWSPGERLGKNHNGLLEPTSAFKVKLDKIGLISADEKIKGPIGANAKKTNKHHFPMIPEIKEPKPLAVLVSFCLQSRWDHPKFLELDKTGPPKNLILMAVSVNKVWYCSWKFQKTRELAKEDAAKQCLIELGVPIFRNY